MRHGKPPSTPRVVRTVPPLPDLFEPRLARTASPPTEPSSTPQPSPASSSLRFGCYLIEYTPASASINFAGTLRVETTTGRLIASGDLYELETVLDDNGQPITNAPDPAAGIPIFPAKNYRYYLRVIRIGATEGGFTLAFEALRFSAEAVKLLDGSATTWLMEDTFTATMAPEAAPAGFPSPEHYFAGDVANGAGTTIGRLTMGLVSPLLRKATVEIDRVPRAELPLDNNGGGVDWRTVFDKVGWDISVVVSDSDVEEPSGESWNRAEAHEAMRTRRDRFDPDKEWRYHVLAVRRIDLAHAPVDPTPFDLDNGESGHMYDDISFGSNSLPREGLMVASHWVVPDREIWGPLRGMRAETTVTYFRTAVHELGHAMGLRHNDVDNGIMNPTETVAKNGTKENPFPNNMLWTFAADDAHRLRHWPDPVVRPGGTKPNTGDIGPVSSFKSDRHKLDVTPVLTAVPLGAPVRVHLTLTNVTDKPVDSPSSLSLNSGFVRGHVIDPAGTVRTFSPLVLNENQDATRDLAPGKPIEDSLTLLQGGQGALFPTPGSYRIVIEVSWHGKTADVRNKIDFIVSGETSTRVTPAVDAAHANAARKVLTTPDALLTLAFGGDHLKDGIEAIGAALKNDVLRPHFAYVEAKRLGTRFFKRQPDLKAAAALIDETTVMSPAEFRKAVQIVEGNAKSAGAAAIAAKLKAKIAGSNVGEDVKVRVRRL